MQAPSKAALAEAVNTLVQDTDAGSLSHQMHGVLDIAARNIPVALTGRASVLNPLIKLALSDHSAYDRVMELIDRKRNEAGLPPLGAQEHDPDRRAYMREFMAERRERLRRLVDLWNELRSEDDKVRGQARLAFEQMHAARWKDEKDAREIALRDKLGRRLSMEERRAISAQLWAEVEDELQALAAFVRSEIRKPLQARSKAGFKFMVGVMPKKAKA